MIICLLSQVFAMVRPEINLKYVKQGPCSILHVVIMVLNNEEIAFYGRRVFFTRYPSVKKYRLHIHQNYYFVAVFCRFHNLDEFARHLLLRARHTRLEQLLSRSSRIWGKRQSICLTFTDDADEKLSCSLSGYWSFLLTEDVIRLKFWFFPAKIYLLYGEIKRFSLLAQLKASDKLNQWICV